MWSFRPLQQTTFFLVQRMWSFRPLQQTTFFLVKRTRSNKAIKQTMSFIFKSCGTCGSSRRPCSCCFDIRSQLNHLKRDRETERPSDSRTILRPTSKKRPARDTTSGFLSFAGRFGLSLGTQQKQSTEKQKSRKTSRAKEKWENVISRTHKMSFRATKRAGMSVLFFGAPSLLCCWWALGTYIDLYG